MTDEPGCVPHREGETGAREAIETVFRADHGRILAVLVRDLGDVDLAEEGLQDAFVEAMRSWPVRGHPDEPAAWIRATARNRAIDRLRRAARGKDKQREATDDVRLELAELLDDEDLPDERLRLIFTCCHPYLEKRDSVALTLRTVAGLTSAEIARTFLIKTSTLQARLTRAKAKIRAANIPYRVPEHHELPARLSRVLDVILLIYNEGYTPATADPVRDELRTEAIRLAAVVAEQMPDHAEALALHALLLFHEVRAPARIENGDLVDLDHQNRTLWNREHNDTATGLLGKALRLDQPGPYQLHAAISGLHSTAPTAEQTDWAEIVRLHDELDDRWGSEPTRIARALAIGRLHGPTAGLAAMPPRSSTMDAFHRWHAAAGDLHARLGDHPAAAGAFSRAAELARNPAERRWLLARATECRRPVPINDRREGSRR